MLPSFRLIVAAFLCGFVVVFAGLRLAATLNHVHASMPITAAHAAPLAPGALAEPPVRRLATPIVYDLRFVGNTTALGSLAALPVSLTPPMADIAVPNLGGIGAGEALPAPEDARAGTPPAVAAIDPDVTTRATPDDPVPESEARFEQPLAEPPTVHGLESDSGPAVTTEPSAPPATPAVKPTPDADEESTPAQAAAAASTNDAKPAAPQTAAAAAPAPTPEPVPTPSPTAESAPQTPAATRATDGKTVAGDMPPAAPITLPTPKPEAAEPATQRAAAKPAPKKKRTSTARRAAPKDPFGFPFQ